MVYLPTLTPNMAQAQAKKWLVKSTSLAAAPEAGDPSERHFCPGGNGSEGNGGRIGGGSMSPKSRTQEDVSINGWFIFGKTH